MHSSHAVLIAPKLPPAPLAEIQPWLPLRGVPRAMAALSGGRCAAVIAAEIEGCLHIGALERAARALAVRHAILRAKLRLEPEPAFAVGGVPEPLPVEIAAQREGAADDWCEEVRAALGLALSGDGPIWRLRLIPGAGRCWLVLAIHHSFVDGRSLSILLRDLLALLDGRAPGEPLPLPVEASELWAPPRMARWATTAMRHVWAWRLRRAQAQAPLRGSTVGRAEHIPTRFGAIRLGEGLIPTLVELARSRGATIGGVLAAAAWSATRALARARGVGRAAPVEAMVDAWAILPCAPEVGLFTGGVVAIGGDAPVEAWARAAEATRRIARQVAWKLPVVPHLLAEGLERPDEWLEAAGVALERDGGCGATAQISNLGRWPHPTAVGTRRLRAVWSASSSVRTGPALLGWLQTVDGVGCVSAAANGAVVTQEELDAWISHLSDALWRMTGEQAATGR